MPLIGLQVRVPRTFHASYIVPVHQRLLQRLIGRPLGREAGPIVGGRAPANAVRGAGEGRRGPGEAVRQEDTDGSPTPLWYLRGSDRVGFMPASPERGRRPERRRLSKLGNEVYLGVLIAALVVIVGAVLAYGLSYVVNFTSWVAQND